MHPATVCVVLKGLPEDLFEVPTATRKGGRTREIRQMEQEFPRLRNIKGLPRGPTERTEPGETPVKSTRKKPPKAAIPPGEKEERERIWKLKSSANIIG